MRVAFITNHAAMYGANRSLVALISGLQKRGIEAYVVAPENQTSDRGNLHDVLASQGIPLIQTSVPIWFSRKQENIVPPPVYINDLRWIWRLIRRQWLLVLIKLQQWQRTFVNGFKLLRNISVVSQQLKDRGIDIVYTNSSVTPFGAFLAMKLGKPHIWHLREFVDLHYGWRYDWGRTITLWMIRRSAAVIAVSNAVKEHYMGKRPSNAYVVYNGVATQAVIDSWGQEALVARKERRACFVFLMVGVVSEQKGVPEALKAFSILCQSCSDVELRIVGGGNIRNMQMYADKLGISDKVSFLGYADDPHSAYLAADAFLMCSRYEGMGRVTAEAWVARLPVIGYDQAGTSELIEHEKDGLLYRNGAAELAGCMERLLADTCWARCLGDAGWVKSREKFCIESYTQQVHDILCRVQGADENSP